MVAAVHYTRRFTADEVLRMVEAGILAEDEPLELLDGELVLMSPQGPTHGSTTARLGDALREAYRPIAVVREEKPLVTGPQAIPEPDLAVVRGTHADYEQRHPNGNDAIVVVEVAVTSQVVDRAKAADYACGAVATYWLLDVPARRLEIHTEPQPDGRYRVVHVLGETDVVQLPDLDVCWTVAQMLP